MLGMRKKKNRHNSTLRLKGSLGKTFNISIGELLLTGDLVYDYDYNIHLLLTFAEKVSDKEKASSKVLKLIETGSSEAVSSRKVNSCFFVPFYVDKGNKSVFSLY